MPGQRKLGRATDVRLSILRGLVTALVVNGKIETTEARAREVKENRGEADNDRDP